MFHENSAVVKVWVKLISEGDRTKEEVPKLSNLQEIVNKVLGEMLKPSNSTE